MVQLIANKYDLNTSKQDEKTQYENICDIAKQLGYKKFCVLGDRAYVRTLPINHKLEEDILFENQYNTLAVSSDSSSEEEIIKNYRIHDWYEEYSENSLKVGYYLTGDIEELNKLKERFYKCGYCGNCYTGEHPNLFCNKCLGSQYLKENELHLCLMQPMRGEKRTYNEEQMEFIKNMYRNCQEAAKIERKHKMLEELKIKYDKEEKELADKKFIELTLVDTGIPIENLIRYDSGWVFGWREPMEQSEVNSIQAKLNKVLEHYKENEYKTTGVMSYGIYSHNDIERLEKFNQSVQFKIKI